MGSGDITPAVDWDERWDARPGRFTHAERVSGTHAWDPKPVQTLRRRDKSVAPPRIEPQFTLGRWSYHHTVTNSTVFEPLTPEWANVRKDTVWYTRIAVRWQHVHSVLPLP